MLNNTKLRRRGNKKQASDKTENNDAARSHSKGSSGSKYRKESNDLPATLGNTPIVGLISFVIVLSIGSFLILSISNQKSPFHFSSTHNLSTKDNIQGHKGIKHYGVVEPSIPEWETSDPILQRTDNFLKNYVCNDNSTEAYCHPLLYSAPQRRTHRVAETELDHVMEYKDTVMVLPRHLLIWDLDAMRDGWVRQHLFPARHVHTGNSIDSGAFLAAFLLREKLRTLGAWVEESDQQEEEAPSLNNQRLLDFLEILPSFHDLQDANGKHSHSTLWSEEEVAALFGKLTPTAILVKGYTNMMNSEYKAFCEVSSAFQYNVILQDYIAMRVNIIARSFGPGPVRSEEEMVGVHDTKTLEEEIDLYRKEAGVDLSLGCRAMSPILDMWDHHSKPNVDWMYDHQKRAFVISVVKKNGIKAMQDITVSYGKYTDTHLFTKFGFVNGDGSGYTEASIAIMHPLRDIGMGQQFSYLIRGDNGVDTPSEFDQEAQKRALVNYLRFDDGYEECITKENNPEGFKLKLLKLRHLQLIANKYDRWTYTIAPRNETSKPSPSSDIPITTDAPMFDKNNVKFDGSKIISTCRLMALNTDDYDGKVIENLEQKLLEDDDNFLIEKQSDQLEFRALTILSRLTTGALHLYPSTVQKDTFAISSSSLKFQSKEWNAAQVRLGEMQSLEVLRSIATSGAKQMRTRALEIVPSTHPSLKIHRTPCPGENAIDLLKDTYFAI